MLIIMYLALETKSLTNVASTGIGIIHLWVTRLVRRTRCLSKINQRFHSAAYLQSSSLLTDGQLRQAVFAMTVAVTPLNSPRTVSVPFSFKVRFVDF